MHEVLNYTYENLSVRVMLKDDGIFFVYRDLCRIPGFRTAAEKLAAAPIYEHIKTAFSSATVRLISRDAVLGAISVMHDHHNFYRWLMAEVLPGIYKRPGCERFRPRPPWEVRKEQMEKDKAELNRNAPNGGNDFQNMLLTQIAFMQMMEELNSLPVVLLCFADDAPANHKESVENDQ